MQRMQRRFLGEKDNPAVTVVSFCIMQMGKQKNIKIKNYVFDSDRIRGRATGELLAHSARLTIIILYSPTWQLLSLNKHFTDVCSPLTNLDSEKFQTGIFYNPVLFPHKPVVIQ